MDNLSQKQKVIVMIALLASMFFAAINQTLVSSAMPRIISMLGGMDYYSWVITIYMLTSTVATILVGKLSDIYGRKPFLLSGIVVFMIGAFLTGLSTNIFQMIAYRGIQGLGGGVLMSVTTMAVGDLFMPRERAKWTGVMMSIFGFSSVIGPTLGGVMIDHMDWKWLFWAFLPLGIVAFVMILRMFPKVPRVESESIDYWGSLFLSLSIIALLLGFSWAGSKYSWGSIQIIGLLITAVIFAVILVLIERKAKSPVMPLHLFKNWIITNSNLVGFLMNAGMMGAMVYLPFFVQGVKGLSPTQSGFVNMPMSLTMVVLSSMSGRWISKSGKYKRYAIAGISFMVIGMLMMTFMNSIALAVASMCVFGVGLGLGMPVFTLVAQNAVPINQLGVVTATATLFRNLGGTIGIAVFGSIMTSILKRNLEETIASGKGVNLSQLDPEHARQLAPFLNPQVLLDQPKLKIIQASLPAELQSYFAQLMDMLRAVLSETLSTVFLSGAGLLVLALLLVFFLKEIPLRSSEKGEAPQEEPV
ncbi:MDR family MFS transporter [Paenibacillus radicis (ex Xue et al. 2023)]|uniref:MFS transporter n=1 Tax=Paenibacillus radicis (ex Xue et al. 2023) TaxID=2972489 RepID=A0ABT1YVD7_9BACL|nr:MDR family MFS transporter [Paenibacillus radicis (ex Xue et al. 2023)]MCR8636915.1 MFS transporter [Paenibacillus radicis (ex Xue et al. 2023)]